MVQMLELKNKDFKATIINNAPINKGKYFWYDYKDILKIQHGLYI